MTALALPRTPTWEVLQKSRNVAAITTLANGLKSSCASLKTRCVKSLLVREEEVAKRALIVNWFSLSADDKELVCNRTSGIEAAAKNVFASGQLAEKRAAMAIVVRIDLLAVCGEIVEIAANRRHPLVEDATKYLLQLCEKWGKLCRRGEDVPRKRQILLERLYPKVVGFNEHKRVEILDAWLSVVHWDDSFQRGLISDPGQPAFKQVLERLKHSELPEVWHLLGGYLRRRTAPKSVIEVLTQRMEPQVAKAIGKTLDAASLEQVLTRVKELPAIQSLYSWARKNPSAQSDDARRLWVLFAASSEDIKATLRAALRISKGGSKECRATAAQMLVWARKPSIDDLVPLLQADSVDLKQTQTLESVLLELARWQASPSAILRESSQTFFSDFTVSNLVQFIRNWPPVLCKTMAHIVSHVQPDVIETLIEELQSRAPKRRMAALQLTELLDCGSDVTQQLLPLLHDSRLEVRVRVIDILSALGSAELQSQIPQLMDDANTDIQDAASRALRRFLRRRKNEKQLQH